MEGEIVRKREENRGMLGVAGKLEEQCALSQKVI